MATGAPEVCNRFSFIIPFRRDVRALARSLDALTPLPANSELIIVTDAALEDCRPVAIRHGARIVALPRHGGPAAARNAAARAATGDVLVFVDADVVVSRDALSRLTSIFRNQPATAAAFGAYDDQPADPGFVSQYKNLSHSLIHHTSSAEARTFWAGFGAVRRHAFDALGGFDERFGRSSVEDIDLGYRLTEAGYHIRLDPALSASHLKRWTFCSTIASDIRDRGVPWTQLIWRYGSLHNDLNLRTEYCWSVMVTYLAVCCLVAALRQPLLLAALPFVLASSLALNRRHCAFFYRKRGPLFAFRAWSMRFVHDL